MAIANDIAPYDSNKKKRKKVANHLSAYLFTVFLIIYFYIEVKYNLCFSISSFGVHKMCSSEVKPFSMYCLTITENKLIENNSSKQCFMTAFKQKSVIVNICLIMKILFTSSASSNKS